MALRSYAFVSRTRTRAFDESVVFSFGVSERERSSLVDPASSHMLVSKIKPCMSQYKPN